MYTPSVLLLLSVDGSVKERAVVMAGVVLRSIMRAMSVPPVSEAKWCMRASVAVMFESLVAVDERRRKRRTRLLPLG